MSAAAPRSSFYWAMRLMPGRRRAAMLALYELAHALDDIADGAASVEEKHRRLAYWDGQIEAAFAAEPREPIARALAPWIKLYRLPRVEFDALLAGMRMDVDGPMIGPPLADLRLYCRRVAGSIGRLSLPVFGCDGEREREFAETLGEALQLTNILRDVREDAEAGRLYLPREVLRAHGIDVATPDEALGHAGFAEAWADCARLAHDDFLRAERLLRECERRPLAPAVLMMGLYRALFDKMIRGGWPLARRPRIGRWRRAAIVARVILTGRP